MGYAEWMEDRWEAEMDGRAKVISVDLGTEDDDDETEDDESCATILK